MVYIKFYIFRDIMTEKLNRSYKIYYVVTTEMTPHNKTMHHEEKIYLLLV